MTAVVHSPIRVEPIPAAQRAMRIAIVTETYPPEVNGVSLTIARIVAGLHRRNHDAQLVRPRQADDDAADGGPGFHEVLMRGLPIPRYPQLRLGLPAKGALVRLWSVARPDVVHIATEGPLGFSALAAAQQLKLPVTSDFRTNFHAYSRHYGVGFLHKPIMAYLRKFHNRAAVTMVPTEALRRELVAARFRNVEVVARGVDTRLFTPARRSRALREAWCVGDDDPVVVCVGRLAAEKNLALLIDAFDAIRQLQPRARLLLVGDGPLRDTLARRAPGAIFAGRRDGEDLAAHYASADLFVFPSLTETFGNVTAEAMASGLPVVAYDYAGAAQLIDDGVDGVRVPFGDGAAFVRAAAALAADPARRAAIGPRARQRACACDWDAVIVRFEAELARAIARHPLPLSLAMSATSAT
jgi:glycosyltransferase involved in cell wall biosynthesis